jgi:hypothetical protein
MKPRDRSTGGIPIIMANDEMKRELEALRAEVTALSKARSASKPGRREARTTAETGADTESDLEAGADDSDASSPPEFDIKTHLEDLVELLENEVKELPVAACLAIFVAGVLVGRITR